MTKPVDKAGNGGLKPAFPSVWPSALASMAFSFAAFAMLRLYALVHWKIMMDEGWRRDEALVKHVYQLLDELFWLRLFFAVLAAVWALWSFRGKPRLMAMVALAFSVGALVSLMVMM